MYVHICKTSNSVPLPFNITVNYHTYKEELFWKSLKFIDMFATKSC